MIYRGVGFITVCVEDTRLESDWDCFWVRWICLCGFGFLAFIGFGGIVIHYLPVPSIPNSREETFWLLTLEVKVGSMQVERVSLLRDAWNKEFSVFVSFKHLYNLYGVNISSVNSEMWHSRSPWECRLMNIEYRLQNLKVLGERCSSHAIFRRLWAVFLGTFYNSQVFLRVVETISSHFRTK